MFIIEKAVLYNIKGGEKHKPTRHLIFPQQSFPESALSSQVEEKVNWKENPSEHFLFENTFLRIKSEDCDSAGFCLTKVE